MKTINKEYTADTQVQYPQFWTEEWLRNDKQIKTHFDWLNSSQYFIIFFYQCAALQEKNASS